MSLGPRAPPGHHPAGADSTHGTFWRWEVVIFFLFFLVGFSSPIRCMADGCWEYFLSPQSISFIAYTSAVHGDMACPVSAQQIRSQSGWEDWCALAGRRAGCGPPVICRRDTTGAGWRSPRSTRCGHRGRRPSWSHPHSRARTAWPPWVCAASPGGRGSAGSRGPRSCYSWCCSLRTSGESLGGWGRFWVGGPPHPRYIEPAWRGHMPPWRFF